ncbi:MAG: PmoA family protein [Kiritimatiellae bacterium]|nr:PmoA family protein [Kiritimatiellia bacterium]
MFACSLAFAALAAIQLPDGWRLQRDDGTVVLEQHAAKDARPYIHPLMAPDGKGAYTENRPKHHPWQHGLYTGLHAVNGVNFWEKETGQFHPKPVARPAIDGNSARWEVRTRWTRENGEPVLDETQKWTLRDGGTNYVLDLEWTLAANHSDVSFGKWAYGGLFLRMPFRKENAKRQFAVNSRGQRNNAAEQQEAEWVEVSMPIEGRGSNGTVRIEDLPGNPGHPNPWRVDGQLGIAPSHCIRGSWRLSKGEKRVNRYRITVR